MGHGLDAAHEGLRLSRTADAQKILYQFLAQAKQQYVLAHAIAFGCSGLGEFKNADKWMGQAIEEREGRLVYYFYCVWLDPCSNRRGGKRLRCFQW